MKLEHWHIVLDAHRKMRQLLDRTLPPGDAIAARLVGAQALDGLQQDLLGVLDGLQAALGADLDPGLVADAMTPLVYLFDEKVLARLGGAEESPVWPMLQRRLYGVDTGGDLFFSFADEKLARGDTPPLIFELLVFCLSAGFTGRYASNAAKLRSYKERITARIPLPPRVVEAPKPVAEPPHVYRFPLRYYLLTLAAVAAVQLLLLGLSNRDAVSRAPAGAAQETGR